MRAYTLCVEVAVDRPWMEVLPEAAPMSPPPLAVWHQGSVVILPRAIRARSGQMYASEVAASDSQFDYWVRRPVWSVP